MKINRLLHHNFVVIKIDGKIIGDGSQTLKNLIQKEIDEGHNQIILDLEQVDLMESSALGAMVSLLVSLQKKGGKLSVLNPHKTVKNILEVTRLNLLFEIHTDLDCAVGSSKAPEGERHG